MPANVIKNPEDEPMWEKAKAQAKKDGKPQNYALIMFLFKKFKKEHESSESENDDKSEKKSMGKADAMKCGGKKHNYLMKYD